jgi:hypothetical protein
MALNEDMAVMFYRLGWKDRIKFWNTEKKRQVLQEIGQISLQRPIHLLPPEERIKLKSVPDEEFSGLQLYAGMVELAQDAGIPLQTGTDAMVSAFNEAKKGSDKKLKKVTG